MLTPDLITSYLYYPGADYKTIQRGQQYFRDGRVYHIDYQQDFAVCDVMGKNDDYSVTISVDHKNRVELECTCPQAEVEPVCKHMIASLWALRQYLSSEAVQQNWQYKLRHALETPSRRVNHPHTQSYAALFAIAPLGPYYQEAYTFTPYILKASQWHALNDVPTDDLAAMNQLLRDSTSWTSRVEKPYQAVNPAGCLNLPPEGVGFLNYVIQSGHYSYYFSTFSSYLPMLSKWGVPIFLAEAGGHLKRPLSVIDRPVEIKAAITSDEGYMTLQAGVEMDGRLYSSAKESMSVVSHDPPWALVGDYLAPVTNPESFDVLSIFPIKIPEAESETFQERYLRQIAERIPVQGDVVTWEDITVDPVPRLYLQNDNGTLRADLRFGYGEFENLAERNPSPIKMADNPSAWTLTRIHRQPEKEFAYYQKLTDARYGLKRSTNNFPYGTFELRARTHPFDFLMHSIPDLTAAGFEIYGDMDALGKVNHNQPTIRLNITSGIDWFDLKAVVAYGDQEVPLRDIRRAIKKGDRYIKLADGSIGQIPEAWLERYKHLFDMAEETGEGYRISDLQLPLVDELLADASQADVVSEFYEKRKRLEGFQNIEPQPVPRGFTGDLRPYQKAGLDWLHFLRKYHFGGILADDMGLGKTIQMLAFLQSLHEQGLSKSATLLVVPKSLLTNWQREASRFTPALRFLEYMGNTRVKEPAAFDDYDVILTTYGTMLRDVDLLRKYHFDTVILDESQAIKNPLAQSAKAVRLLKADHHLTMTGTPVENNTFELWSQFAFCNPGLLGSMDYFRREFANSIESKKDEESAKILKRMVFPFILRRTKEQVAPELPERTERIIYTDLEPAQRKLYNRTRDNYRAELMGLINKEGMDNARMKILEGLLRLRQICIHPALIEPTYNREAAKFEVLLETLQTLQSEGHKALIFSQFVQSLKLLEKEMQALELPYTYLDGQTTDRQERVDRFQNDPSIRFFLISLKAGGVGLNLTAADYVIHLDPWWNPAVEMQAADRAHRIGQDKPVFIYKLIARETVEEKILELQAHKRQLVEQLISAEGSFFKSLTKDDVKVLFS